MDFWTLYFMTILPGFAVFFAVLSVPFWIGSIVLDGIAIAMKIDEDRDYKKVKPFAIVLPIVAIMLTLLSVLIPDKSQMYTLIGGYYVTNIENVENLPKNVVEAANKFLEEYAVEEE